MALYSREWECIERWTMKCCNRQYKIQSRVCTHFFCFPIKSVYLQTPKIWKLLFGAKNARDSSKIYCFEFVNMEPRKSIFTCTHGTLQCVREFPKKYTSFCIRAWEIVLSPRSYLGCCCCWNWILEIWVNILSVQWQ